MNWDGNVEMGLMYIENAKEMMSNGPAIFVGIKSPGRLDGVFWVTLSCGCSARHFDKLSQKKKRLSMKVPSSPGKYDTI